MDIKMCQHQRHGVLVAAVHLLAPLGAAQQNMLVRADLWAAVCGPDGVWPCGGVWPREMRVEGRRRSKMLCGSHCGSDTECNQFFFLCCINSATCDPLTNSLIPFWHGLKSGSPTPLHNPLHALSKTTLQLMEISGVAGLLPGAAGLPGC